MRRGSDNIYHDVLIGLETEIISSTDPSLENIKGIVVDETARTLKIYSPDDNKIRIVSKIGTVFKFKIPETMEEIIVMGDRLLGRPGQRIKKVIRI